MTTFIALTLTATALVACGDPAEPVTPLDGTSWRLVSLNGHDLVEDTHITLRFADGFIQGFAGCNAYRPLIIGPNDETHQYQATRDDSPTADAVQSGSLTIPNFIITDKDCPSPEGVMEQERAYVETLRNAAAYRVIEDRLEIENAAGETILVFDRGTSIVVSPTPVSTSEAVIPPTLWMTYTNSVHRFSLRHPPGWEAPLTPQPQTPTSMPAPSPTLRLSPRVLSFSAEPVETEEGEGIGLTWKAEGEQATICPLIDETAVGCRCLFDVPLMGSHIITPADIIGAYTGFELAVEAEGVRTVRYAPLAVECPDAFPDWFFDPRPAICPNDAPLFSSAAAQRFEHGMMIWIEALDDYYILLNHDENVSSSDQGWSTLTSLRIIQGPLELKSGASPDNRVEEDPPLGLFEPVSGFGLVWRGEVTGTEDLRSNKKISEAASARR
jgi:heat shock protein HslJ